MDKKKTFLLIFFVILIAVIAVFASGIIVYNVSIRDEKTGTILSGDFLVGLETYDGYCDNYSYTRKSKCENEGYNWIEGVRFLSITNGYPVSDKVGAAILDKNSIMAFGVSSEDAKAYYVLSLSEVVFGKTLNENFVKMNVIKNGEYILGSNTSGVLIKELDKDGDDYIINNSSINRKETDIYVVRLWIDENYIPPITKEEVNDEIVVKTVEEKISFKVKVTAERK